MARIIAQVHELKPQEELPNQKLPYELLLILFSYLHIPDDLVSVQRVSSGWRAAALDKSLWKKFTLTLFAKFENEKKVKIMPAIRNIDGYTNNDFINLILENIIKLSKLNVMFDPPLTLSQLQVVLEKYADLESISLSLLAPDISECLEVLKTSENLMEVIFYCNHSYPRERVTRHVLMQIFDVFTDKKTFPALSKTNLVNLPLTCNVLITQDIMSAVSNFISEKPEQLLSRKIKGSPYLNLRETVCKCTKLQELDLENCSHPFDIIIDNMTELKSLRLSFLRLGDGDNFNALQDYFHRGSWEYLTEVSFTIGTCPTPVEKYILSAIINNVKQLKHLYYYDQESSTIESELREIGNLPKLVNLIVCGLYSISEVGMSYISSCLKLKVISQYADTSSTDDIEDYVRSTLRQSTNLKRFVFQVSDRRIYIRLTNREEFERFTSS